MYFKQLQVQYNFLCYYKAEILYYNLVSLNKLNTIKKIEYLNAPDSRPINKNFSIDNPASLTESADPPLDPKLVEALETYNPSDLY